jgi:hypothetical protein
VFFEVDNPATAARNMALKLMSEKVILEAYQAPKMFIM